MLDAFSPALRHLSMSLFRSPTSFRIAAGSSYERVTRADRSTGEESRAALKSQLGVSFVLGDFAFSSPRVPFSGVFSFIATSLRTRVFKKAVAALTFEFRHQISRYVHRGNKNVPIRVTNRRTHDTRAFKRSQNFLPLLSNCHRTILVVQVIKNVFVLQISRQRARQTQTFQLKEEYFSNKRG